MIFAIGAGVSAYEGYVHIVAPEELRDPLINYIVLGIGFLLEGTSWGIAVHHFVQAKGDTSMWQAVKDSKDPSSFVVLFEDSAALAGLAVAVMGVWASHHFAEPRIDGVASIIIGGILGIVALLLARESKGLLIGERADPAIIERVRATTFAVPGIIRVNHVRTVHTGPDSIFVAISADFDDAITMGQAEGMIENLEARLREAEPKLASIYIRPERREEADELPA